MKKACLTFDDGPNTVYTSKILDILKHRRTKACFFLIGKNVERYPAIALRIKREGHLIGNHTYSHSHMKRLSSKAVMGQIEAAEEVYSKILNVRPIYFRPPYGEYDKRVKKAARSKGYKLILWDCCAEDWRSPKPQVIAERIVSGARDCSIILLHDGANIRHGESRKNTVSALPVIIKRLKERNFKIVRLDKLCPQKKR